MPIPAIEFLADSMMHNPYGDWSKNLTIVDEAQPKTNQDKKSLTRNMSTVRIRTNNENKLSQRRNLARQNA